MRDEKEENKGKARKHKSIGWNKKRLKDYMEISWRYKKKGESCREV